VCQHHLHLCHRTDNVGTADTYAGVTPEGPQCLLHGSNGLCGVGARRSLPCSLAGGVDHLELSAGDDGDLDCGHEHKEHQRDDECQLDRRRTALADLAGQT